MEGYTVKRCPKCVNNCPLDNPKCVTGRKLAGSGDIYEPLPEENSLLKKLRDKIKRTGR